MPVRKRPEEKSGAQPQSESPRPAGGRRPWKKKTPVEVFLDQETKLRQQIEQEEQALKQKRDQLKKFEEARRIFESS